MSTVTKCTCEHEISQHTYSEDFTGCDVSGCNCMLDLGELIDKYQIEVTDRTEQGLKDTEKINDLLGELILVERNYDALQTPMPCGHLARYAVNADEGTQYCVLCVLEVAQQNIKNLLQHVSVDEKETNEELILRGTYE